MMSTSANKPSVKGFQVVLGKCSSQVQELYPLQPEYQDRVQKLWADTADNPGPRQLQRKGYEYLVSLYYGMPKRAEVEGKAMSPEFGDLTFFARYVGPRPTAKHSLHRMNNDFGYRIGNVEWADKRKQAEVRRNTQHHHYLGRRLTDRQLADFLAERGCKITAGAIKKQRQRYAQRGIAATEITREIFNRLGIPYATSTDPVEAWDFPAEFHAILTRIYPHFRGTQETRIDYFLRWLEDQALNLTKGMKKPYTSIQQQSKLRDLILRYQSKVKETRLLSQQLHQQKMDKVIAEAGAPFSQSPALPQTPAHPEWNQAKSAFANPLKPPAIQPCPETQPVTKPQPASQLEDNESVDGQFLIDRDFWSGLPHFPSRKSQAQHEEWERAFKERKEEFAKQGKFPAGV